MAYTEVDLSILRQTIVEVFTLDDLRTICFDLRVDFDSLVGNGKAGKARELVGYFEQNRQIDRLLEKCRELRPFRDWTIVTLEVSDEKPPFKGLAVFDEDDTDIFYGREAITDILVERLHDSLDEKGGAFLAVVGASGSGKSSLVRAGVMPALRRERVGYTKSLKLYTLTPSDSPTESLATTLSDGQDLQVTRQLVADLNSDPTTLRLSLQKKHGEDDVLLFVDQFEELFTLCDDETLRRAFIDNLITATSRAIVLVTLRADFYAQCSQYENLRDQLEQNQKFLGPMTRDELRRAIEVPAQREGYTFETGLVDLLLREVGDEPGALPLLSHALLETWKRRRERRLTFQGYNAAGGIEGAIAKTADSVYEFRLDTQQRKIAQQIFISLTELGETQDTRRRAPNEELLRHGAEAEVREVLNILATARLIIVGNETSEVTHEALIREWPALRHWLDDNREGLRLQRQLVEDAQEWAGLHFDEGALYRGVRLAQAVQWMEEHQEELNGLSRRFLAASKAEAERVETEKEAQRQRELEAAQQLAEVSRKQVELEQKRAQEQAENSQKLRRRYRTAIFLFVLSVALTAIAVITSRSAIENLDLANRSEDLAEQRARIAEANVLASNAEKIFDGSPQIGLLLAIEAVSLAEEDDPRVPEAEQALWYALSNIGGYSLFEHELGVLSVAVDPNGRWLATGGDDYAVHIYELDDLLAPPVILYGSAGPVFDIAITHSGLLIAGSWSGNINVWDMTLEEDMILSHLYLETGGSGTINSLAVSDDGKWLVTGSDDAFVTWWDLEDLYEPVRSVELEAGPVTAVDISPDSSQVAIGTDDGQTYIWNLNDLEAPPRELSLIRRANDQFGGSDRIPPEYLAEFIDSPIYGLTFTNNPNDLRLITVGGTAPWQNSRADDHVITVWSLGDERRPPVRLNGHEGFITSVAVSHDDHWMATTSWDNTSLLWDMRNLDLAPIALQAHEDYLTDAVFSLDGRYLFTTSADHTTRVWDIELLQQAPIRLQGHEASVTELVVTDDDQWLASGGADGTILLWLTGEIHVSPRVLRKHQHTITALATYGNLLVSGDESGALFLWDITEAPQGTSGISSFALPSHNNQISAIDISPDGEWLLTTSYDGTAKLWLLQEPTAVPITLEGHDGAILNGMFTPDGRWAVTTGEEGHVRLWGMDNPGIEQHILLGHSDAVLAVDASADGRWLLTGGRDHVARLWNLRDPDFTARELSGHLDGITDVAISTDGYWFTTASLDNTVRLWSLEALQEGTALRGHSALVTDVTISDDDRWLISTSYDQTVQIWDLTAENWDLDTSQIGALVLSGHEGAVNEGVVTSDGRWLATASEDGRVFLWHLRLDELIALACDATSRDLTEAEWEQYIINEQYVPSCD